MNTLLTHIDQFSPRNPYVLAIMTETIGSTYRKAGAMMLIDAAGQSWGLLSGGCLENDIIAHANTVFTSGKDKWLTYNMKSEGDLVWGLGLGCDGQVTMLLKYLSAVQPPVQHSFFTALSQLDAGHPQLLLMQLSATAPQLVFIEPQEPDQVVCFAQQLISLSDRAQPLQIDQQAWLAVTLRPSYRLLICGATPDVAPVVSLASQLGWQVTVIDHRPDHLKPQRFAAAKVLLRMRRADWETFDLRPFDAVVIMSHHYERDQHYLARLLPTTISYIGLLGPQQRRDQLLADCNTTIDAHQGRVFGPVGLQLGAQSPETIALSIVAQIQAQLSQSINADTDKNTTIRSHLRL